MKVVIEMSAAIYMNGIIIYFDEKLKRFLQTDYESGKSHSLAKLDNAEDIWGNFGRPLKIGDKIYFPPCNNDSLVIFEKGELSFIPIAYGADLPWKYTGMVCFDDELYLLPGNANGIICINMNTKKQLIIKDWYREYLFKVSNECKKRENFGKNRYGNFMAKDGKIYIPLMFAPVMLEVDRNTKTTKLNYIDVKETGGFLAIYEDKQEHIYFITRSSNQIIEMDGVVISKIYNCAFEEDIFGSSLRIQDKILILGVNTSRMVVFDMSTKKIWYHSLNPVSGDDSDYIRTNYSCMMMISDEEFMIFNKDTGNFLGVRTLDDWQQIKLHTIVPVLENVQEIIQDESQRSDYVLESELVTLDEFLKYEVLNWYYKPVAYKLVGVTIMEKLKNG